MVPKNVQDHIRSSWNDMETRPTDYQPMDPEQWHVTFVFLGEVPDAKVDEISAVIADWTSKSAAIKFVARGFESFPPTEHRYLTVHLDSDNLDGIETSIEALRTKLVEIVPTLDTKPWLPHISILRAYRDATLFGWKHGMPTLEWTPDHVVLSKSVPGKTGPVYTELKRFEFPKT